MTQKFSLAHLTVLQCSPLEMVEIAEKTGYDFVSFRLNRVTDSEKVFPLLTDKQLMQETKRCLSNSGIKVLDVELVRMSPEREPETYLPLLEAAAELGAKAVITQIPDYDRHRTIDRLARLCELAAPFNITIDLEFLPWIQSPNLESVVSILKKVDCGNAGLLIDTLHFHTSGSDTELLKSLPKEWFNFVHLCDAKTKIPDTKEGLIQIAREERLFPGEGEIDLLSILSCLPDIPYSLEIPNSKLMDKLGPEEYARRAIQVAKHYLQR